MLIVLTKVALFAYLATMSEDSKVALVIAIVTALAAIWTGCFLWAIKWLLNRHFDAVDKRFNDLAEAIGEAKSETDELRQELAELKAELPTHYIRKEDWIRQQTAIDAKLDDIRGHVRRIESQRDNDLRRSDVGHSREG